MSAKQILIPAKFTVVTLQLIFTFVIYASQDENLAPYANYTVNQQSLEAGVSLSVIFLILELALLFSGVGDQYHKSMLTQILIHSLGVVIVIWFILGQWHFNLIWMIWTLFCFIPVMLEVVSVVGFIWFHRVQSK